VLIQMPRTTVQHPEQIGMQWLIVVRKESESEIGYYFGKRVNCFTRTVDGLVLRSLFPVMVFWVTPWAVLCFED